MALKFSDNFQCNAPKNIDNKSGVFQNGVWRAYESIAEAQIVVPLGARSIGLTQLISVGGLATEHWYREGIEDTDLIIKENAGIIPSLQLVTDGTNRNATSNSIQVTGNGGFDINKDGTTIGSNGLLILKNSIIKATVSQALEGILEVASFKGISSRLKLVSSSFAQFDNGDATLIPVKGANASANDEFVTLGQGNNLPFIKNQTTPEASSNFNISGIGKADVFTVVSRIEGALGANSGHILLVGGAVSVIRNIADNNTTFSVSNTNVSANGNIQTWNSAAVERMSLSYGGILKLNTVPTTSAGTYDILTRNIATGSVEKKVIGDFVLTTGDQTIDGNKDFSARIKVPFIQFATVALPGINNLLLVDVAGEDSIQWQKSRGGSGTIQLLQQPGAGNKIYRFPANSGTLALLTDIPVDNLQAVLTSGNTADVNMVLNGTNAKIELLPTSGSGEFYTASTGSVASIKMTALASGDSILDMRANLIGENIILRQTGRDLQIKTAAVVTNIIYADGKMSGTNGTLSNQFITKAYADLFLPLAGGNMSGNINYNDSNAGKGLVWNKNTDWGKIYYESTGDFDGSSQMVFESGDNILINNGDIEGWIFRKNGSGDTPTPTADVDVLKLAYNVFSFKGNDVLHTGFITTTSPPASSGAAGKKGQIIVVGTDRYECIATNTWIKSTVVTSF